MILAYLAALGIVGALDALWLGVVAARLYRRELGELLRPDVRPVPAALFYFGYPLGLLALALQPLPATLGDATARSAVLGLVAYGTYDLTNLATLKGWSRRLALLDIAWGTAVTALAGAAAWWVLARS